MVNITGVKYAMKYEPYFYNLRSTGNNGVPELHVDALVQRLNIFPFLR